MATETKIAGTGANVNATGRTWTSPGNITANDGANATQAGVNGSLITTDILRGTNFGFSIPTGSTINGIEAKIEASATNNNGVDVFAEDFTIYAVKNSTAVGNNLAGAGTLATSPTVYTYGGAANLWGTTWTVSDINSANFGVQAQYQIERTGRLACTVSVDYFEITVHYTPPASGRSYGFIIG